MTIQHPYIDFDWELLLGKPYEAVQAFLDTIDMTLRDYSDSSLITADYNPYRLNIAFSLPHGLAEEIIGFG